MIKAMIVDDEKPARVEIRYLLEQYDDIKIVAECSNAIEALKKIQLKPDVIFLDIEMPQITGLEFASMIDSDELNRPRIVFVTAYDQYAIEAFKNNAIDYLLKPVEKERLEKTLKRIREGVQQVELDPVLPKLTMIPCFKGASHYFINSHEIIHVQSNANAGIDLTTVKDSDLYHTNLTLKALEQIKDLERCHAQHLVNNNYIKLIKKLDNGLGEIHTTTGYVVPVSRSHMNDFRL